MKGKFQDNLFDIIICNGIIRNTNLIQAMKIKVPQCCQSEKKKFKPCEKELVFNIHRMQLHFSKKDIAQIIRLVATKIDARSHSDLLKDGIENLR